MKENELTREIIAAAMRVHSALGPGLLESAYEACLAHELSRHGLAFERQKALPVMYDGIQIDCGYRIDLLVNDSVMVELKAVDVLLPIHHAQLLSYLRLSGKTLGLLINFHEAHLRDGIVRKINHPRRTSEPSAVQHVSP
ncbi:MAG TPA: GxxExxY protein [Kiritimatiellia bacterium]|nr:GxxExxY protein [Kiritimatiellia bacterium]HRZ11953.1 GxxExxY protein [Kiritimatiellia bacterium]HSA17241.1 GxxExxY protein [Kiritimatiellia bacterium]